MNAMHAILAVFQLTSPRIFQTRSASRMFFSFSNTASNLHWLQLPPAAQKSSSSLPRKHPYPFLIIQSHVFGLRTRDPLLCSQQQPSRPFIIQISWSQTAVLHGRLDQSLAVTSDSSGDALKRLEVFSLGREKFKKDELCNENISLMKQRNSQHTSESQHGEVGGVGVVLWMHGG